MRIIHSKHETLLTALQQDLDEHLKSGVEDKFLKTEELMSNLQILYDDADRKANKFLGRGGGEAIHLPQLKLQEFSGDIRQWIPFWAGFEEVDKNPSYSDAQKFQYLL